MKQYFFRALAAGALAAGVFGAVCQAGAQTSPSFAGKTVKIIIPAGVGGEYGLYSQTIANYLGKYVAGNPSFIVQAMPGGAGLISVNWMFNVAPKDGTVLFIPPVNAIQDGVLDPKVKYDPSKIQWIGRIADLTQVGVVNKRSGVGDLNGAKTKQLVAAGIGYTNPTAFNARVLNELAGTKFKILVGYRGTADVELGWLRGEVDLWTVGWDAVKLKYAKQLKSGEVIPLFVYSAKRLPELPDVPLLSEFGRNDVENAFLKIYTVGTAMGRSLAAPPGVAAPVVEMYRAAFSRMLKDPQLKATLDKAKARFNPMDSVELEQMVGEALKLTTEQAEKARAFYKHMVDNP